MSTFNNIPNNIDKNWLWSQVTSRVSSSITTFTLNEGTLTIDFSDLIDESQQTLLASLITACPLIVSNRTITKLAFRSRFTFMERMALDTSTAPEIVVLRNDLSAAEFVDLDYPDISFGLDLLISKNIITPQRKAEILA